MTRVAIISAMRAEVADLHDSMTVDPELSLTHGQSQGMRDYWAGELWGVPVVVAWSRWGKVAAASTTTHVLQTYRPREVILTGVAGSIDPDVRVGDVVVADTLVQHDMDASPLFPRHEIPLLGVTEVAADPGIKEDLLDATAGFLTDELPQRLPEQTRAGFRIGDPRARVGQILTGDQFISGTAAVADLRDRFPGGRCVEMEGAAVAQVCFEHSVPFGVIRTISDTADHNADIDFEAFLRQVAATYSHGILRRYLAHRRAQ